MALTPDGALGGLAIGVETTWGTAPVIGTFDWQNYIDSTLGIRRTVIQPQWATFSPATNRKYSVAYSDGELKLAYNSLDAVVGGLLGCGSTAAALVYTFGSGDEPDNGSFTVRQNYGGGDAVAANWFEWQFAGCKPTAYKWDISMEGNVILTVPVIGKAPTRIADGSVSTPAAPAESGIMMPTDIVTVTYGGSATAITLQGASISVDLPKTGSERRGLGQTTIREPVTNGQPGVKFSVQVDLDASTGNDTISILDAFVAGTELGELVIGDFTLNGCMLEGDPPSLSAGLMQFALTGRATSLDVTLT